MIKLPPYLYNMRLHKQFVPGESTICYAGPYWGKEELSAATQALMSGKWLTAGENVRLFEREFAKYNKQKYATMVNSGSSANLVMISALKEKMKWDDSCEVLVSVSGFPTTVAPIVQCGLKPVFVDVELGTLNFDLERLEAKINENTVAIFVSPVLGNPPDMNMLEKLENTYGIEIILDCCDSLGSSFSNRLLPDWATASSYSFYPAHHICTGEGGMVTTNDKELHEIIKSMVNWGRSCFCSGSNSLLPNGACGKRFSDWLTTGYHIDHKFVYGTIGYNLKPLDLQGAIGLEQLKKLDEMNILRRYAVGTINLALYNNIRIEARLSKVLLSAKTNWFGIPIFCKTAELKEKLVQYFEKNKIQTRPYFAGNILRHPAYKHLDHPLPYPNADEVMKRVFFLGCSPTWSDEMIQYIIETIRRFK